MHEERKRVRLTWGIFASRAAALFLTALLDCWTLGCLGVRFLAKYAESLIRQVYAGDWMFKNSSSLTSLSVRRSHCHSQPQSSSSVRLADLMGQVRDRGGKKGIGGEYVCVQFGGVGGCEGWGDCKTQVYVRLCVVSIATFKLYDYASLCTTDTNKL